MVHGKNKNKKTKYEKSAYNFGIIISNRTPPKYRRLEHLLEKDVPTQTEIRSYLGSSLAQIFNDYSKEPTRKLLGVVPPLKGPVDDDLWISPSDQLIGKVALKPPLTIKYTKACTHQGILEIGERAMLKFEKVTEENIRKKLEKESMEKRKIFEAEKRRDIELRVREIRNEYEKRIERLSDDYKKKLETAVDDATRKSNKEMQKAIIQERLNVEMRMMKKLREEVGRVVVSLNHEFEQSFRAQRDNMVADFNAIMRRERRKFDARSHERKKARDIVQCRQCNVDAAVILCTEMPCSLLKNPAIQQNSPARQREIEVSEKIELESTTSMQNDVTKDPKSNHDTLNENSNDREFFQIIEIIDKDGNSWRPIQLEPEIPRIVCTDQESASAIVSSEINFFAPDRYTDRISESSGSQSLHSSDSLPFCYLDGRLYVRSDYREKNDKETISGEPTKRMGELAEGARFIMELKRSKLTKKNECMENS